MTNLTNALLESGWLGFSLLLIVSTIILFLARNHAHKSIAALTQLLYSGLRLSSNALSSTQRRVRERNRDVLLQQGREQVERDLCRNFSEISQFVQRDLGGYPEIQRDIKTQVTQIQDDYQKSGEVPSVLPEWVEAIDTVSNIKSSTKGPNINDTLVEQIVHTAEAQHKELLEQAREDAQQRHSRLKNMCQHWRKLSDSVDKAGNHLHEVITRSANIDRHMAQFNEIIEGSDGVVRSLKTSAITQFIIALIVITIAIGGAYFNFHLIALPMSEMVGSVQRVGGVKVSDLAALVVICLEMTAGIFLLDSLRITRLFPLIGAMDDKARKIIIYSSATVLFTLASTESALAFMRDQIAVDLANLRASLAGIETVGESTTINEWIPLMANMILGFILPLALTMIAIPLEYLLQTGRTVCGGFLETALGFVSAFLRVLALSTRHLGKLLISLYDFVIAAPLWLEHTLKQRGDKSTPMIAHDSH